MARIAFLGPEGTFTEAALHRLVAAGATPGRTPWSVESAAAALAAVRDGDADYACVPIENSIDGSILPTLDGLATGTPLQILAEVTLDIEFTVAVRPDVTGDAATVAVFPVAHAQVRRTLADLLPAAVVVAATSNAAAARDAAAGRADAAVTTALAARRHGLTVIADGVLDEHSARTRFVLVGPPTCPPPPTGADRTSVVLRLDNRPGALVGALEEFAGRGIDLTRIESRPTRAQLGTYLFFVDCAGHVADASVGEALTALYRRGVGIGFLGSWPTNAAGSPTDICRSSPPADDAIDDGAAGRWLRGVRTGVRADIDANTDADTDAASGQERR